MFFFHRILHPAVLIYDFHIFITSIMLEVAWRPFARSISNDDEDVDENSKKAVGLD